MTDKSNKDAAPKKKKGGRVGTRVLKGLQDFLPREAITRRWALSTIERVYQRYGFSPVETPALEHLDVLLGTGGEETNKELFRLQTPEEEEAALRFDLTVPFARVVAQYPDRIKTPFRRYTTGPVWRADKPGPWRFRQFTQIDADIAGATDLAQDAELIALIAEVMRELGVASYRILINNRKLVDALLESCGISDVDRQKHVLRVIDKLQKVGLDNIRRELGEGRVDDSGDPIPGVHLDESTIDAILGFIDAKRSTRAETVAAVRALLPDSDTATSASDDMALLNDYLESLGVDEAHAVFDPSLARGLDYYTGPVFEITFPDAPEFGSVGAGGRYDGLVSRFQATAVPCTGFSIGLERFLGALDAMNLLRSEDTCAEVLVVTMGDVPRTETLKLTRELRDAGLCAEPYFASKKKMKMGSQLSHADHYGIPVAVILGEDELANGVVSIKDLYEGKRERSDLTDREEYRAAGKTGQVTVARAEMIETIRSLLAKE